MDQEQQQLICIVDDSPVNIKVLSNILKDDYQLCEAPDGETALTLIRERRPDLVLLDIVMPGQSGIEVCTKLKQDSETKDIPVVFVTTQDDHGNEAKGFEAGGSDYITKPVSPIVVKHRISLILQNTLYIQFLESMLEQKTEDFEMLRTEARSILED